MSQKQELFTRRTAEELWEPWSIDRKDLAGFEIRIERPVGAEYRRSVGGAGSNNLEAADRFCRLAVTGWRGLTPSVLDALGFDTAEEAKAMSEISFHANRLGSLLDADPPHATWLALRIHERLAAQAALETDRGNA